MTSRSEDGDARGCFVFIGIILVFFGVGVSFGWGITLWVTGVMLIVVVVLDGVKRNDNRPNADAE
jgi:uncharacterized protein (DUF983 family)